MTVPGRGHLGAKLSPGFFERVNRMFRNKRVLNAFIFIVIVLVAMLWIALASAQSSSCAPREIIVGRLADKYGETRQSMGLNQNNGVVELFASQETGTWTITVTMPNGMMCLMAAGQDWQADAVKTRDPGSDA